MMNEAEESGAQTQVVVIDDHPLILRGLVDTINREPGLHVCATAQEAKAGYAAITTHNPDVILLDLFLKSRDGIELIKSWKALLPDLRILVLSAHDEAIYAERVLHAGANGYVMKSEPTDILMTALRTVAAGELYLSRKISDLALRRAFRRPLQVVPAPISQLTDRELHILQLVGQRMGTRQIADELRLSVKTIESHRENIKAKLEVKSAKELLDAAVTWVERGAS